MKALTDEALRTLLTDHEYDLLTKEGQNLQVRHRCGMVWTTTLKRLRASWYKGTPGCAYEKAQGASERRTGGGALGVHPKTISTQGAIELLEEHGFQLRSSFEGRKNLIKVFHETCKVEVYVLFGNLQTAWRRNRIGCPKCWETKLS